ncbi:MAG: hypothetical protein IJZ07_05175 [Clostridia bacterium]|nr:hypothetical protein [Clostridia bacterium]
MKSLISIILVLTVISLCFFGCKSNIPEEPATTGSANYTYINPYGQTAPNPDNVEPSEGQTFPVVYVETVNDVEIVLSDYYVYGNSVASIKNIKLKDDGISVNADGYAEVEVQAIGSRKDDIKIGYLAYDANGKIVRNTYILVPLKGVKEGEIVSGRRFDFPREAVKIVFVDYVEEE